MKNMKDTKKLNNKGFSLVELIIVIVIMAVLVGVLAPQYIKYVNKSKVSVDTTMCDNLRSAMMTTYLDPTIKNQITDTGSTKTALGTDASGYTFWTEVYKIMSVSDAAGVKALLSLDSTGGTITYTFTNDKFCVYVDGGKYTGTSAIKVE